MANGARTYHTHTHTTHHGGLPPWYAKSVQGMKTRKKGSRTPGIPLGKTRRIYIPRAFNKTIKNNLKKVRAYGEACLKLPYARTLKQQTQNVKTLQKAIKGVPGVGKPKKYRSRW